VGPHSLEVKVGRIVAIKKHEQADTLYVEQIDLGEDKPRTIVSGLVNYIPIEKLEVGSSSPRSSASSYLLCCFPDTRTVWCWSALISSLPNFVV